MYAALIGMLAFIVDALLRREGVRIPFTFLLVILLAVRLAAHYSRKQSALAELNHHIRNPLQAITFAAHLPDHPEVSGMIRESAFTIKKYLDDFNARHRI